MDINTIKTFTPYGDIIELPENATVLDFSFYIHTKLAYHCSGAYVNGIKVNIDYVLKDNDVVKIYYTSNTYPKNKWFNIVKTKKAKRALNSFDWIAIRDFKNAMGFNLAVSRQAAKTVENMEDEIKRLTPQIKLLHTKVLLKELAHWRLMNNYEDNEMLDILQEKVIALLKRELSTREHIPNKIEARKIRQAMAKNNKANNKGKRNRR